MKEVDLESWLGNMGPAEFESEENIKNYFRLEELRQMFPGEEIDPEEAERAEKATLEAWRAERSEA